MNQSMHVSIDDYEEIGHCWTCECFDMIARPGCKCPCHWR